MDTKEVSITLTVAGWNAVLAALGSRPYAEVAAIIEAIKMQAAQQLTPPASADMAPEEA
jgi:ActR/RegA family two-component response regulator